MSRKVFSARKLSDRMAAAHVRAERVAVEIDRSVWTIHEYRSGRVVPPLNAALRIAALLGCTLDDLLDEEVAGVA